MDCTYSDYGTQVFGCMRFGESNKIFDFNVIVISQTNYTGKMLGCKSEIQKF